MSIDDDVRRILAGQSPDYLIRPDATAFRVEGLDPADVQAALERLAGTGHAEEAEVVLQTYERGEDGQLVNDGDGNPVLVDLLDGDGNPVVVASGWAVTAQGAKAHAKAEK